MFYELMQLMLLKANLLRMTVICGWCLMAFAFVWLHPNSLAWMCTQVQRSQQTPSSKRVETFFLDYLCGSRKGQTWGVEREQVLSLWGGHRSRRVMEGKIPWKCLYSQITKAAFFISCSLFHNRIFLEITGETLATNASHLCRRFNVCLMDRV